MTGSAFSLHAVVPAARFAVRGSLDGWSRTIAGGSITTHHGCAICKTRTHSTNPSRATVAIVSLGTMENSMQVTPLLHMWVSRKQNWIGLPRDAETYDEGIPAYRLQELFSINIAQ
jgi:hypothetical protein